MKVGFNMCKVNFEVGFMDEDEEDMFKIVCLSGMFKNMGFVDILCKFICWLKVCENVWSGKFRVWDYGYDWWLSLYRLFVGFCEFFVCFLFN